MALATINFISPSTLVVQGVLNFDSVMDLQKTIITKLVRDEHIIIDLKQVTYSNSAGVALLIEWQKQANRYNRQLAFINVPLQMHYIIQISGLTNILHLQS